jgi:hypothetical protein
MWSNKMDLGAHPRWAVDPEWDSMQYDEKQMCMRSCKILRPDEYRKLRANRPDKTGT